VFGVPIQPSSLKEFGPIHRKFLRAVQVPIS
jgi:hypothetical protein